MTADRRSRPTAGRRPGVTLIEVVVTVAILAVLSAVVVVSVEASSRAAGQAERVDRAAAMLEALRDASVRSTLGTRGDSSFAVKIGGTIQNGGGTNPSRLSHLTNKIATTSLNSCGIAYGNTIPYVNNWTRNFYNRPLATGASIKLADGFIADDQLVRFTAAGAANNITSGTNTTTPGTLAIVIRNVSLSDAQALADRMEGSHNPASIYSVVRFTASGNAPVDVYYHMAIRGC